MTAAARRGAPRDAHLLAVGEPRGEIDAAEVGAAQRAAGAPHGIARAAAGGQPVDARVAHRADDVDDDRPARPGRAGGGPPPVLTETTGAGSAAGARGPRQNAPDDDERSRARDQQQEHEAAIERHRRTVRDTCVTAPRRERDRNRVG